MGRPCLSRPCCQGLRLEPARKQPRIPRSMERGRQTGQLSALCPPARVSQRFSSVALLLLACRGRRGSSPPLHPIAACCSGRDRASDWSELPTDLLRPGIATELSLLGTGTGPGPVSGRHSPCTPCTARKRQEILWVRAHMAETSGQCQRGRGKLELWLAQGVPICSCVLPSLRRLRGLRRAGKRRLPSSQG